ncbi:coiled-coil and C2 domain-containing protein 1B isoform X2 [Oncorhynchus kisutch]|uniref:coiled-coil and C2 domain-containing protein 1B isoform X1 n=1 Tax=Oncorhynchus kisutch TaxID=8019 RepID=UPI0012DF7C94|nr:coiled-coil and C2 domain-containing protein 1B isoform X1 [Oncorhynchus kisutch]XP_031662412.1 coiled-coil and C2 domain-containing protein 1B isoform X1 [Oncorhynchus kisutch]XP_031662413.1 coiled-coil and C2 domain-containing protein 1B isoform X1 [Oncorhynchus kisutch]XP_031662414.1 coiled-coil and C2 domain-containing protein 1B isoform X2 [Oncorhynchus kisutch]
MFGKKKRAPLPKGQGAAAAKQMGLFVDFNPEEMTQDMDDPTVDDADLEAELSALTGGKPAGGRLKQKAPLPMENIARMAEECMKDIYDDDDDDNLEDDEDLLAELQEVVGDEETEDHVTPTSMEEPPQSPPQLAPPAVPGSLQHTLEERLSMYRTAVAHAKASGESSKARRYDRGIQSLESMLVSLKKGRKVDEADIPPPVAGGAPTSTAPPRRAPPPPPSGLEPELTPPQQQGEPEAAPPAEMLPVPVSPEAVSPSSEEELSISTLATVSSHPSTEGEEETGHASTVGEATKAMLLGRQREYKVAALKAKQQGDMEQVKLYFRTSKRFDAVIEALEKGQEVDLSCLPPSLSSGVISALSGPEKEPGPGQTSSPNPPASTPPAPSAVPAQPKDVLEALEQRRDRYQEACAQAKASGDDRKARMHERIAKQYQSAIRTHKAGRAVNYAELPVPPGFHPIPGQEGGVGAEQGFSAMLEAANKLASEETIVTGEEEGENEESKPPVPEKLKKPMLAVPPTTQRPKRSTSPSADRTHQRESLSATALQQLDFVEGRRQQYMKAALQAKQKNDMDAARTLLRTAKGLEPLIDAVKAGKHVDISKVPSPPGDEDEDFILVHHSEVQISEKADEVYTQLAKMLKEQYEKCMTYSKQFTHLGNIAETTKFEKMAESCKKSLEMLKLSQSKRLDPPKHHFEERTYHTVRIFPELSSTEMVVVVVRGMNLPAPSGIATNDLDAYVKFDFPYPSTEQPQKHRTAVVKNTNSPEFNQGFTLNINRNHRGFRRVVQSKGLKLELLHKGGFLRSDKPIGTAHIKLEKLETESEVREIVEVIDGRKPTGGRVEVRVRLREPLSGQDLQTTTERWLVLDQSQVLL